QGGLTGIRLAAAGATLATRGVLLLTRTSPNAQESRPEPSLIAAERRPELPPRATETGPLAALPDLQGLPPMPVLPGTVVVLPSIPPQPEATPGALQPS
ncbi:hypothetical protein WDA79_11750, partial [Streptomyces sp. A475]